MSRLRLDEAANFSKQLLSFLPQQGFSTGQIRIREDGSFEILKDHFYQFAPKIAENSICTNNSLPSCFDPVQNSAIITSISQIIEMAKPNPQIVNQELNREKFFSCHWDFCNESFNTRSGLATHCSEAHLFNNLGNIGTKRRKLDLRCHWMNCKEEFQTLKQLMKHLALSNHIGQSPYLSKQKESEISKYQTDLEARKRFQCSFPGCGKSFTDSSNRKKHERIHDANRIRYKCSEPGCDKSYTTKADLKVHLRVHKRLRDNICTFPNCGKAFVRTSELYAHERTHDNVLPHVCNKCGKGFRETTRLKKHQQEQHSYDTVTP